MSATSSNAKDYKKMARNLHTENKTLKGEIKTLKEDYKTLEETATENEKQMKTLMKDYKTKTKTEMDEMKEQLTKTDADLAKTKAFCAQCVELTGKDTADEVLDWVEQKANEDQAEKTQQDALRMLGELQVKFNLLTEQMEEHKVKTLNSNKKQKGLSGQHRKEDCINGNLRPFVECRCSAISWANGLAQQCSRHWDKHADGKSSHLCATHHKLLVEDECGKCVYTGSWGLYHQERPKVWGEHGLKVQNEWKKRVGKNIPYKLKQADYETQFAEMASKVPAEVPRFDYPKKVNGAVEAPAKELAELFSDDEEDDNSSQITIGFSDDEGDDVANLADVETPSEGEEEVEQEVEQEVVEKVDEVVEQVEEEAEDKPVAFAKQAQLDRLEKLNAGAIAVDYDVLVDLRAEKAEFEKAESEEEEEFECYNCANQFPVKCAHYPFEADEAWCFDCQRDEVDAQKYQSNCLSASEDSE